WISLRVIGAIGVAVMAMTIDARIDARRDAGDAVSPVVQAGASWCVMVPGRDRNCSYLTFERCLKAVDAIAGTSRPNPATLVIADDGSYWTYRSIYRDHAGTRL